FDGLEKLSDNLASDNPSVRHSRMTVSRRSILRFRVAAALGLAGLPGAALSGAPLPKPVANFLENNCADCHDGDEKTGDLDLTSFAFDPANPRNFAEWVKIHDRAA